ILFVSCINFSSILSLSFLRASILDTPSNPSNLASPVLPFALFITVSICCIMAWTFLSKHFCTLLEYHLYLLQDPQIILEMRRGRLHVTLGNNDSHPRLLFCNKRTFLGMFRCFSSLS